MAPISASALTSQTINFRINLQHGYGPEVVSYRVTDDDVYVNGSFDVDIHYFDAHGVSAPTNFTLDVVLNETGGGERRSYQYRSIKPLVVANSNERGPEGTGESRFNFCVQ